MTVTALTSPARRPLPMPSSAILCMDIFGLAGPTLADQLFFTLTRRKEGTEVGLKCGKLWWSLSYLIGVYPKSFRDARVWVAAFVRRYGWEATELPRPKIHS